MKIINYILIFSLIMIPRVVILDHKYQELTVMSLKRVEYKRALENAADDALTAIAESVRGSAIQFNKEAAVSNFLELLSFNFGIEYNQIAKDKLYSYIPIILITDNDGYYIYYQDFFMKDNKMTACRRWTEKLPYTGYAYNTVINYTLGEHLAVYDPAAGQLIEGYYLDLVKQYPYLLPSETEFDSMRRNAIIQNIIDTMNYYITYYNKLGSQFGISYRFYLPDIPKEEWYRTIDDISMVVIFQGYPYGSNIKERFNQYAFAGTRLLKESRFYINKDEAGHRTYHRENCTLRLFYTESYSSKSECARRGAYACTTCNP